MRRGVIDSSECICVYVKALVCFVQIAIHVTLLTLIITIENTVILNYSLNYLLPGVSHNYDVLLFNESID